MYGEKLIKLAFETGFLACIFKRDHLGQLILCAVPCQAKRDDRRDRCSATAQLSAIPPSSRYIIHCWGVRMVKISEKLPSPIQRYIRCHET